MMLCNRLVWIDAGRVRMDGKPAEVANRYALSNREQEEQRLRQRRIEFAGRELASEQEELKAVVSPARIAFGHIRRKGGTPLTSDLPIAWIGATHNGGEVFEV